MKLWQRFIAMMLIFVLSITSVPVQAWAETTETDTSVDTGDLTIEGTNSFGALLSEEITESQEEAEEAESEYEAGYAVTDLLIEGNQATVTYDTLEEAIVVVALYSEDGMQLLNSGKTNVIPDDTTAYVTIEGDMPEYFYATAFLLDTYDMSPLCASFETPMYTKEMQELLASTVEDYDEALVLNLDEDPTTNFAVYETGTKIIDPIDGVNTVVTADPETLNYVIENADEQFTSLQVGDIVAYSYGENMLMIAKVAEISVSDTTVTITGDDSLTLEEVFSHMKIEDTADTEDMTVDDTVADEGVTFEGMGSADSGTTYALQRSDDPVTVERGLKFSIFHEFEKAGSSKKLTLSADLELKVVPDMDFYIAAHRQYIKFTADITFTLGFVVEGSCKIPVKRLAKVSCPLAGGAVTVNLEPQVTMEFSAALEFTVEQFFTLGFSFDSDIGFRNLCTEPRNRGEIKLEGTFFIGLDPEINMKVGGFLAELSVNTPFGLEVVGTVNSEAEEKAPKVHACDRYQCLYLKIYGVKELSISAEFLKTFKLTKTFKKVKVQLFDHYWSGTTGESGLGECPNVKYRTTITTRDINGERIGGIEVSQVTGESIGTTNDNGTLVCYLPKKSYGFKAEINDQIVAVSQYISAPSSVLLTSSREYLEKMEAAKKWMVHPQEVTDWTVYDQGTFNSGAQWIVYASGQMVISGDGAMDDYSSTSDVPWDRYRDKITSVEIQPGITRVGSYAFGQMQDLEQVIIPDTVTDIGLRAFLDCSGLKKVKLPIDYKFAVKIPGGTMLDTDFSGVFSGCTNVTTIHYTYGQTGEMIDRNDHLGGSIIGGPGILYPSRSLEWICASSLETIYFEPEITKIGDFAFNGNSKLTNIQLPESIEWIGDEAFRDFTALTELELPEGLIHLGEYAFSGCSGLTKLVIPDLIESIGAGAFSNCNGVTEATVPAGFVLAANCANVKTVRITAGQTGKMEEFFSTNHDLGFFANLETVYIDPGVTTIGSHIFSGARDLKNIHLPDTLTSVGDHAFSYCESIISITLPESVTYLDDYAFRSCTALKEVVLPDSVTSIGDYTFSSCAALKEVVLPDSVTSIGDYVFSGCTALKEVVLPDSITSIGDYAFGSCTSLQKCLLPYNLELIPTGCFSQCTALTEMVIPSAVQTIADYAFSRCTNLSIDLSEGLSHLGNYAFQECTGLKEIKLPSTLEYIGEACFSQCTALTEIVIPDSVRWIAELAFEGCIGLNKIEISPSSKLEEIWYDAFYNCTSLTKLVIPSSVDRLGSNILEGCTSLTNVIFLGDVPTINSTSFTGVTATAEYPADNETWTEDVMLDYGGTLTWKPHVHTEEVIPEVPATCVKEGLTAGEKCSGCGMILVAQEATPLLDHDFGEDDVCIGCGEVLIHTEEVIPEVPATCTKGGLTAGVRCSVCEKILVHQEKTEPLGHSYSGNDDCANCGAPNVTYPVTGTHGNDLTWILTSDGTLTVSGEGPMEHTYGDADWIFYSKLITAIVIEDGISNISASAFYGCEKVQKIILADSVTSIEDSAFRNCTDLAYVELPESLENIGSDAFMDCTDLGAIVIPDSVASIGERAFSGCSKLESIVIPEGIEIISDYTFSDCTGLTEVSLPDSISRIGEWAFQGCENLISIEFPENVTDIGHYAFCLCSKLESVTFKGDAPIIDEEAFLHTVTTAYYPIYNITWTEDVMQDYGGMITWMPNGEKHPHEGIEVIPGVAATCTEAGLSQGTKCSECGEILIAQKEIPALGHSISESGICTECGEVHIHTEEVIPGVAATCTTSGLSDGVKCSECGVILVAQEEIPVLDHSYDENDVCTNCGAPNVTYPVTGTCGNNLTWILTSDGTLTVSGEGSMVDTYANADWMLYSRSITGIVIEDGITNISAYAFSFCEKVQSITLADSITTIDNAAFRGCTDLANVTLPEDLEYIGAEAFRECPNLVEIVIPDSVVSIGGYAFDGCSKLQNVILPSGINTIAGGVFSNCSSMISIVIPESVTCIGSYAFYYCAALESITFEGNAPVFEEDAFADTTTTVYYPAGDETWTEDVMQNYGGTLTWVSFDPETDAPADDTAPQSGSSSSTSDPAEKIELTVTAEEEMPTLYSHFGGTYESETMEEYILKRATFVDLVPGEEYLLLVMVSMDVEDPLADENLLYIDQDAAAEDGTLVFEYVQRTPTDLSYVVACGASNKDLKDAVITFPEMTAEDDVQSIEPVVVYDGETLLEGIDYIIIGTVDYTEAGDHSCTIRGINEYTGVVECTYTVGEGEVVTPVLTGSIRMRTATLNLLDKVSIVYKCSDDTIATNDVDVAERGVLLFDSAEKAATKDPAQAYETIALEWDADEQRYIGQSEGIDARDMDKSQFAVAYVKMVDGTYIFSTKNGEDQMVEYSPLIYCTKNKDNALVGALCCAMMHYGAAAQVEQYGMTTGLMNEGFDEIPYDETVLGETVFSANTAVSNGLKLRSVTMDLKGAISYIVKFSVEDTAIADKQLYAEYTLLGETGSVELTEGTDGRMWATISGVPAKDLGATLKVKPYYLDENGEKVYGGELVYSGYEYVRRALTNANYTDAVKDLAKALAMYIHYADAYGN